MSGESPLLVQPQTPPGKEIPFPESQFTPDAQYRLSALKRKASEASLSAPPRGGSGYVKWRLLVIRSQLEVFECTRESLRKAYRNSKLSQEVYERHRAATYDEQDELEAEEKELLEQGKFIEEDLTDSVADAEGAYIHELYTTWRRASSDGQKNTKKEKILAPNKFKNAVTEYLGGGSGARERIPNGSVQSSEPGLAKSIRTYIFGANDAALASVRNGIIMNSKAEEAFDNGWVTIVPKGSVEATPTEWKIVLLHDTVRKDTVYTAEGKVWRFEDLHNRTLTWRNENRPARRYLYFRYVMAIMHAEYEGWKDYRDKVPSGQIWASPNKPDGYLRKSVLRSLARKIDENDILPEDLIEAGGFMDTDPSTGTEAADKIAELELGISIRRECKKKAMRAEEVCWDKEDAEDEDNIDE